MSDDDSTPVPDARLTTLYQSYALAFGTETGRFVLADLKHRFYLDTSTLTHDRNGAIDAAKSLGREAQRDVILLIMDYIRRANLPAKRQRRATSRTVHQEPSS